MCSEIFGKSSKMSSLVCLYNKQNIACPLVDDTNSSRVQLDISLMRFRVEHAKIKFISTHRHVISSMYLRVIFSEYRESEDTHEKSIFLLFHQNIPLGELIQGKIV